MPAARSLLAAALAASAVALAGCTPETAEPLVEGDCLLVSSVGERVTDVPVVSCDEPHEAEVYAVVELAGIEADAAYDADAVVEATEAKCVALFENYIGEPYRTSRLDVFYTYPLEEGWANGDRGIVCAAYAPDQSTGRPLTFTGTLEMQG